MNAPPRNVARRALLAAALVAGAAMVVVMYFFDPEQAPGRPLCLFRALTGWECPGCGGLRATHQLLHGHLLAALRYNALAVALEAAAGWLALREAVRETTGRVLPAVFTGRVWAWGVAPAAVLFGVLRNVF